MSDPVLGHEVLGAGARRVIVMNDWLCDTSTWQSARVYLDKQQFSWCFADLRGYGRSRGRTGAFNVIEAAADILALADALGWQRFSIVGHSMSTYVALHLGQHANTRVERVVLITPGPRRGFGADAAWLENAQANTRDNEQRAIAVTERFAARLSPGWGAYKRDRWLAVSDPEAAAGYIAMFA
ncbi:MAG TPA: alpha/beta hydrolase, partial [Polyangiales bacterium]|nr:alpha/beta hydrolase [Polyangiales bacterium]